MALNILQFDKENLRNHCGRTLASIKKGEEIHITLKHPSVKNVKVSNYFEVFHCLHSSTSLQASGEGSTSAQYCTWTAHPE